MQELTFDNLIEELINNLYAFTEQLPKYFIAILLIAIGIYFSNYLYKLSEATIKKSTDDDLIANFLAKTIKYSFVLIIFLFGLKIAGLSDIATGLFAAAGASAVIIGFAFRDIGENFISGVILSFNRPFNVNDTISVGDIFGKVKNLEFRYTKLKTFDGKDVYIPNSDIIKKAVYNYTEDGYLRIDFIVSVSDQVDIDDLECIILKAIRNTEGVIEDSTHEAFTSIDALEIGKLNVKSYFWIHTLEYRKEAHQIKRDAINNVKKALNKQLSFQSL